MRTRLFILALGILLSGCSSTSGFLETHQGWKPPEAKKTTRKPVKIRFTPKSNRDTINSLNRTIDRLNSRQHKPMRPAKKRAPKAKAKKGTNYWKRLEEYRDMKYREL